MNALLRNQLNKDYSNLTKEEREQLLINEQKSLVGARLALVKEEKQKQLQTMEENEAREAALREQTEQEKQQATIEAKRREEAHPITVAYKKENSIFLLFPVKNGDVLRYSEVTSKLPVGHKVYNLLKSKVTRY